MGSGVKKLLLLIILILSLVFVACQKKTDVKSSQDNPENTDNTTDNFVEAYGNVKVKDTQTIALDFSCKIEEILIHNGEKVKFNQPVLTLSYTQFTNEINKKELELMNEQLELNKLNINQYNINTLGYQLQKKKVENLAEDLSLLKKKITSNNIIDYQLCSPIKNGLVDELNVTPGSFVLPDNSDLFTLLDLDTLYISANIPEEFIKDIKPAAKTEVTPVADKSKKYQGKITKIAGIAHEDNGETVVNVEIKLDEFDEFLLPNFNVDVKIFY